MLYRSGYTMFYENQRFFDEFPWLGVPRKYGFVRTAECPTSIRTDIYSKKKIKKIKK
jgi:hypothetical protein